MSEKELQHEVLQKLRERYGEDKVVLEPSLKGKATVYPDIAVFQTEEQTTPFLLVECSRFRTAHRRANDFEEISEAVSSTQAEYGALVSQNAEFVFTGNGPAYKSYAAFPEIDSGSATDKRPIQSQAELEFLVERAHTVQDSIRDMPGREEQVVATAGEIFESGGAFETTLLEGDDVVQTLVEESANHDLTVIGATREGAFQRFLFGTIPETVATRASNTVIMAKRNLDVRSRLQQSFVKLRKRATGRPKPMEQIEEEQ